MSTMEKLMETGMDVELEAHFAEFFLTDDEAKKEELRKMIDERGFQDPVIMKHIGKLQRENVLKPGIYKEFVDLNTRLQEAVGGNGVTQQATPAPKTEAAPKTDGDAKKELTPEEIEAHQFTDEQEEKIKKQLQAEEEKLKKRLQAREQKIRERMILGRTARAQRLGLKAEDAAKIEAAMSRIKEIDAKVKDLREEKKAQKAIIEEIRPKRNVKPASHAQKQLRVAKRKLTMAKTAGDAEAVAECQKTLDEWEKKVAAEKTE